jgi:uncharacterized phage protein (TIGR01671 family)
MFKPIKYKVVFRSNGEIKSEPVSKLIFSNMGVEGAFFKVEIDVPQEDGTTKKESKDVGVQVDWIEAFLQEFTSKFDKLGAEIYSGDILKTEVVMKDVDGEDDTQDRFYVITFFDGAFLATNELTEEAIPLTEEFCLKTEKVGTIYQNSDLIEKPIDESIFEEKTNEEETTKTE